MGLKLFLNLFVDLQLLAIFSLPEAGLGLGHCFHGLGNFLLLYDLCLLFGESLSGCLVCDLL